MEKHQTPQETSDEALNGTEGAMPPSAAPASDTQDATTGTPVAQTRRTAPGDRRVESGRAPALPLQPGEGPTTEIHWHGGRGHWFLVVPPSRRQVSCRTDDRSKAERFKARFERGLPTIDAGDVCLGDLFRNPPAGVKPMTDHDRAILEPHWAALTIKDVTYHGTKAYYDARRNVPAGTSPPTDQMVRGEIAELAKYARAAAVTIDPDHRIRVFLPKRSSPRTRWLRHHEVRRLLWACRGRIWDPASRWCLVDPVTGRLVLRDAETIAERGYLARLILLGLFTGSRLDVMLEACWSAKAAAANTALAEAEAARKAAARQRATGRSVKTPGIVAFGHIDLVDGVFFRQGSGPTNGIKRCPPVKLFGYLPLLARRWHRIDTEHPDLAKRSARVIHAGNGRKWPLTSLVRIWQAVVADAGLDADVVRHTLRHTAATWLLEGGYSIEETAAFLGVSMKELMKTYAHVDTTFTHEVAEAVDRHVAADRDSRLERIAAVRKALAAKKAEELARQAARDALARASDGAVGN